MLGIEIRRIARGNLTFFRALKLCFVWVVFNTGRKIKDTSISGTIRLVTGELLPDVAAALMQNHSEP
jgi:hypothetical protein